MLTLVVSMNRWLKSTENHTGTAKLLEAAAGYVTPYVRGVTDIERQISPANYSPTHESSAAVREKERASEQAGKAKTIRGTGGQHGL